MAAALLLTRFNFGLLASKGYLDIPYCALLTWAIVLEAERPRRGGAVWWLLGLAGLLRPEAWLLAGVYGLWLGRGGLGARLRALLPAAAAPVLWAVTDLVVTGDPLFSIHHTDALAAELQREIPYSQIPRMSLSLLTEILKVPLLVLAGVGIVLAVRDRRRALAVPGAVAIVTLATYYVIATGGLPTVYRYLLPTGIGLLAFAAYALTGWARLPAGSRARGTVDRRRRVRRAGRRGLHGTAPQSFGDGRPAARADRAARRALHAAARPGGREGVGVRADHACPTTSCCRRCAGRSALPESRVRARSDRTLVAGAGVALTVRREFEERPALNVYEVPGDGRALNVAPAGPHTARRVAPLRGLGGVLMCGIAGLLALPGRRPAGAAPSWRRWPPRSRTADRTAPGTISTRRRAGDPAARARRSGLTAISRWPTRTARCSSSATASSTTIARCGASSSAAATRSGPARTSRCSCTSTRSAGRRSSKGCAACSRWRCGTSRAGGWCSPATRSGSSRSCTAFSTAGLAFASELKALLALPGFPRDIDPDAVEAYLALNAVPAPATIFRAARKLEPGHRLIADGRARE